MIWKSFFFESSRNDLLFVSELKTVTPKHTLMDGLVFCKMKKHGTSIREILQVAKHERAVSVWKRSSF